MSPGHEERANPQAAAGVPAWAAALLPEGSLSVVIPAFNECRRLPRALREISAYLDRMRIGYEILVVDDGSDDGTSDVVNEHAVANRRIRLIRLPANAGKGAAVKAGMLAGLGRWRLFTDTDQSTPIESLPRLMIPLLNGSSEVAMGSRGLAASEVIRGQKWYRRSLGIGFGLLTKAVLVRGFVDCQCGFKCFSDQSASRIFSQLTCTNGLFDMEVMLLAGREGYRVAEVPVIWTHDEDSRLRYSAMAALGLVGELLRIRSRWHVKLPVRVDVRDPGPAALEASR